MNVTVNPKETTPDVVAGSVSFNNLTSGGLTFTSGTGNASVTATVNPSPVGGTLTETGVTWTIPSNSCIDVSGQNTNTISITPKTVTTTQQVTITATAKAKGANGATVSNNFTVTVNPAASATVDISPANPEVNLNGTVVLKATPSTGVSYQSVSWNITNLSGSATGTSTTEQITLTGTKAGTVSVTANLLDASGKVVATKTVTLTVKATTNVGFTLTPASQTVSVGATVSFTAQASNLPANVTSSDLRVVWSVSPFVYDSNFNSTTTNVSTDFKSTNTFTPPAANQTYTITATLKNSQTNESLATAKATVSTQGALYISAAKNTLYYEGETLTLTANFNNSPVYESRSLEWSVAGAQNNYNRYIDLVTNSNGTATVRALASTPAGSPVRVYVKYYYGSGSTYYDASYDITVSLTSNTLATATVSTSTSSYALGDVDDAGKSSIVSQLDSYFYNKTGYYGLAYVQFTGSLQNNTYGSLSARSGVNYYADRRSGTGTTTNYLSDVLFYPGNSKGTASFPIRAYYYTSNTLNTTNWMDGTITFNVTEGVSSSGDITYTADLGKDVAFDLRDFEDYYYNKTRGTLSYVTFTLPSGGTLYYDGGRLPSSNSCYASPSRTQIDLAGIYFTPTGTTATRPGSVRINFTAYGSRNYSGGTSGTVVINYLSGSAKDITYTPSGKSVSLRASDFTEAYRQAVGSTAPSGLTIQFQDVPSYGTLTYKDSSRSNSSTVTLRSSNIKNYKFTTRSSGSNQLADVTYTPSGSRNESITYIAYNGNTPQFTGKVVFNPTVVDNNMSVTFTGGQTITLDYQRFVQANASVMASTTRIRFMSLPVYGTLTYNGATVSAAGTDIVPSLLGNVVYRSSSATTVTDKVVFTCYNAAGDVVGGGQVNLNSTGTGGNNGGVTNISQFKDVNPNAWYASDLSILLSRGIMQGKLEGKFDPLGQLKYGEALKIFLLSAGYSAQEGTGKDWAAGYKTLAVNNGWISSDVDLDAKITRNAMAELAAKVLGLSATSSVPPAWKDGTSNGYANALYYTSPQILVGNADGTFKGNDTLQRQEICKIAARVLNYKSNQQSSQLPGWLS